MAEGSLWTPFLWVARLEGVSLLLLFFVAMPLKYGGGFEYATEVPGLVHGLLFVAYVLLMLQVGRTQGWPMQVYALGFLASLLPFGTFLFERRIVSGAT